MSQEGKISVAKYVENVKHIKSPKDTNQYYSHTTIINLNWTSGGSMC